MTILTIRKRRYVDYLGKIRCRRYVYRLCGVPVMIWYRKGDQ